MLRIIIASLFLSSVISATTKPTIGILTNPSDLKDYDKSLYSYFPSSYVKWIEQAGARVIPIHWDSSYDEITSTLNQINGVLFTGGDVDLYLNNTQPGFTFNKFTDTASFIFQKVIQFNKAGKFYPLLGICQGFQLINYIASSYYEVLTRMTDDLGKQRLLEINSEEDSFVLKSIDSVTLEYLKNVDGPYYSHNWGVVQQTYEKAYSLGAFFKIIAYSRDGANLKYIAICEGREVPIYGYQFHPEKHQFEWITKATHDVQHITYSQQLAMDFVAMARKNDNAVSDEELAKLIIYNYKQINRMEIPNTSFSQVYLFDRNRNETKSDQQQLGIYQNIKFFIKRH
ncbi:unnamed protein product [Paramecium octaurelia]|uniref:folate gamma-glutamyl hydrolase n=1 Tax=Paramecium octaurelia TaxID=43137 RepID=A0A8S1TN19_PAROT|nr:unnamed protein product [Paramecium octaurelia]